MCKGQLWSFILSSLPHTLESARHSWLTFFPNFAFQSCFHVLTHKKMVFIWVAWRDVEEVWGGYSCRDRFILHKCIRQLLLQ